MASELAKIAIGYAEKGWPVFPVKPKLKIPASRHGCLDATADPERVLAWWTRHPDHNIGLATGHLFDVLDLDGDEGMLAFDRWCTNADLTIDFESLPLIATPSGGMHLYFASTGAGNRAGMLHRVDWRGKGGYVVAGGSIHPNGGTYTWLTDYTAMAPPTAPPPLAELVAPPQVNAKNLEDAPRRRYNPSLADGTRYGIAALQDEARRVAAAGEGVRNHQLNESAFVLYQLVAGGQLTESAVTNVLATAAGIVGLTESEIAVTLRSARKAGMQHPRAPRAS